MPCCFSQRWMSERRASAATSPPCSFSDRAALVAHAMVASMSRKGDCRDNAPSESFLATLRAELVDDER